MLRKYRDRLPVAKAYEEEIARLRMVSGVDAAKQRIRQAELKVARLASDISYIPALTHEGLNIKAEALTECPHIQVGTPPLWRSWRYGPLHPVRSRHWREGMYMAAINTIDDIQAELHTLKPITVLAHDLVREMDYPEDPTGHRVLDEVTSLLTVISERIVDLEKAVSETYSILRYGGGRADQ
jgi:hypothetical protein